MRDWTIKFESWLKPRIPLGISAERERVNLMLGLFLSALWAVVAYMGAYAMALSDLYTTKNGKRILLLDSRMADFGQVFRFVPAGFLILIGLLVAKRILVPGLPPSGQHEHLSHAPSARTPENMPVGAGSCR